MDMLVGYVSDEMYIAAPDFPPRVHEWEGHSICATGASSHERTNECESADAGATAGKETNPDEGGGEMVCFETPSGGQVFSVGSISWTSSIPVDDGISKITASVQTRFL